ncbi:MAG TPA: glycosyltransferase family 2 protein [Bryobacteraceae bacterium]|jgi:cellulose synthase/poly-beta-1,6-N-acetylglucosamine synthase-like glycosyltransferase
MPVAWIVLLAATAVALYIMAGYPLLLSVMQGRKAPPIAKDLRYQTTVSVIMTVYNGAAFIRAKLESLLNLDYPKQFLEIIVVSDGSSDETESIVREFGGRGVVLIVAPHAGKAAAVNRGLERAMGEILFFTDVRQPLDRMALRHLVANFADPTVGAVSGELRLERGGTGEQADMDLYWRYEVWARKRHSRIDSVFNTTGCIYAMRRNLAEPIPPDTLSDDAVLPQRAFFRGYRIILDPEAIAVDYPALHGTEFRRRWRTLAGLWQVFARRPQLFTSADRMRFHFLSHKFSRLMLPWSLITILVATAALPGSPERSWMMGGDGALLLLAILDPLVPPRTSLKRLSSPARTFLGMNLASLAAIVVFFIPAHRLWVPTRVRK